jgi:HNH endonuclease
MPSEYLSKPFQRDNQRYCRCDLLVNFENFMLTQEDHLVPASKGGSHSLENLVVAGYLCNKLKGHFVAECSLSAANRSEYVNAVREEIMKRRSAHMRDHASWTHDAPGATPPAP